MGRACTAPISGIIDPQEHEHVGICAGMRMFLGLRNEVEQSVVHQKRTGRGAMPKMGRACTAPISGISAPQEHEHVGIGLR